MSGRSRDNWDNESLNMAQEVITPELARQIAEYEQSLARWESLRRAETKSALYFAMLAVPLWVISFVTSALDGPLNRTQWFAVFTVCTFLGALGTSIAAMVVGGVLFGDEKPVRPHHKIDMGQ